MILKRAQLGQGVGALKNGGWGADRYPLTSYGSLFISCFHFCISSPCNVLESISFFHKSVIMFSVVFHVSF